ncbi:hypothetical protein [Motiliproteus sp. SC1-56]|uniref:hypothetical protein n=1 Tax=Motiliproteus sp. SC1-56 TaxID=2799565 RepID=UPI001A9091D0|nr:hypothetical protein [Motiliproteus sp. SC1-56]
MRTPLTDRLTWVLLAVCALLALALVNSLREPGPALEAREYAHKPVALEGVVKIEPPPPLSAYQEITARPLFVEGRRPPVTEAQAVAGASLPFLLEGIVITSGEKAILVRKNSGDKLQQLREGEGLSGWTLEEITANEASFSSGSREQRLVLKTAPAAKP